MPHHIIWNFILTKKIPYIHIFTWMCLWYRKQLSIWLSQSISKGARTYLLFRKSSDSGSDLFHLFAWERERERERERVEGINLIWRMMKNFQNEWRPWCTALHYGPVETFKGWGLVILLWRSPNPLASPKDNTTQQHTAQHSTQHSTTHSTTPHYNSILFNTQVFAYSLLHFILHSPSLFPRSFQFGRTFSAHNVSHSVLRVTSHALISPLK